MAVQHDGATLTATDCPASTSGDCRLSTSSPQARSNYTHGRIPPSVNFQCGWGAAFIETCCMYPTSKVIFRQQLHGLNFRRAFKQVSKEGAFLLYRGLLPPLIQKTSCRAVMFGMYEEYQELIGCKGHPSHGFTACHASAAFMAGATEALMCPLERVQVLLQSQKYHHHFKNTLQAFKEVRPYGLREYYRGFTLIVLRNGCSNVMFFGLRDPLKRLLSPDPTQVGKKKPVSSAVPTALSTSTPVAEVVTPMVEAVEAVTPQVTSFLADFGSGAVLGASISTVFYPWNVVKARQQNHLGGPFVGAARTFAVIWRERKGSVRRLFRGVQLNFTRSLLTWGITNAVFELLLHWKMGADADGRNWE